MEKFNREIFDEMRQLLPHKLPESIIQFENGRIFSLKPKNYPRSENEQIWYFSTKKSGVPSRYSGCICM